MRTTGILFVVFLSFVFFASHARAESKGPENHLLPKKNPLDDMGQVRPKDDLDQKRPPSLADRVWKGKCVAMGKSSARTKIKFDGDKYTKVTVFYAGNCQGKLRSVREKGVFKLGEKMASGAHKVEFESQDGGEKKKLYTIMRISANKLQIVFPKDEDDIVGDSDATRLLENDPNGVVMSFDP